MTLLNIIFWIIYDLIVGAYTAVLSNIFFIISTIIAIVRYDILKVAENKNNKFIDNLETTEKYNN